MKRLVALFLLFSCPMWAATTLVMYSTGTNLVTRWSTASTGYGCAGITAEIQAKRAVATTFQGITAVTITHTPTSTAPPCLAANSTAYYRWVSDPIASGSIGSAGTLAGNVSCAESAAQLNGGFRFKVYRWSVKKGGIDKLIHTSATSTECAGAKIAIAALTVTGGATTFDVGDRLIIDWEIMNVGTWAGNGARTISLVVGAASGTYGDTQVVLSDTLTFGTDTNNGRKMVQ